MHQHEYIAEEKLNINIFFIINLTTLYAHPIHRL